jgi:hypothetical protein
MVFAYEFSLPISFFPGVWWKRKLKRLSSFNRFNTIRNKEEIKNAMKQRQVIVSILNSL